MKEFAKYTEQAIQKLAAGEELNRLTAEALFDRIPHPADVSAVTEQALLALEIWRSWRHGAYYEMKSPGEEGQPVGYQVNLWSNGYWFAYGNTIAEAACRAICLHRLSMICLCKPVRTRRRNKAIR